MNMMVNKVRQLSSMFPGFFGGNTKHDFHKDFGHPGLLKFADYYQMYMRNGLAASAIDKTVSKTWQTNPEIWESTKPTESREESDIRQRFSDLRVWQRFAEADRRAMVGGYSGVILRFADGKPFDQPVERVPGGLQGLVEVIPVWAGQLTVSKWHQDVLNEKYGHPELFGFNEAAVGEQRGMSRSFNVHPDRVLIWSKDSSVFDQSDLSAGFNDLIDMQKISGAGGEGFWKNAKASPILQVDKEVKIAEMAKAMGVDPAAVADAMEDQVADWTKGFDSLLMLMGMEAKTLSVSLPIPEHFFSVSLMGFAASMNIPQKILSGSQTGERASTEDANEWALANMSRRTNVCLPMIQAFTNRLEQYKILPERDWHIEWASLLDSSPAEKVERAAKMADINAKSGYDLIYSADEIRAETGHMPLNETEVETKPTADKPGEELL